MLGCLFEIVETLVLTLIIFLVIQNFVAQPYKVQQQSMEHTLSRISTSWSTRLTPRLDTYKRGDIVVFTPPRGSRNRTTRRSSAGHRGWRRQGRGQERRGVRERHGAGRAVPLRDAPGDPPEPTVAGEESWTVPTASSS